MRRVSYMDGRARLVLTGKEKKVYTEGGAQKARGREEREIMRERKREMESESEKDERGDCRRKEEGREGERGRQKTESSHAFSVNHEAHKSKGTTILQWLQRL